MSVLPSIAQVNPCGRIDAGRSVTLLNGCLLPGSTVQNWATVPAPTETAARRRPSSDHTICPFAKFVVSGTSGYTLRPPGSTKRTYIRATVAVEGGGSAI